MNTATRILLLSGRRLPRAGLLIYLARPNSDEYLIGEDTEVGEDTYIWGYVLPDDADIRAATGWVSGTANVFYTATGVPIVALATEIAQAVLPANIVFSLVDATTQTGKLAIYTAETTAATLAKARSILRDESINYLFYGRTAIAYDPQDLASMYQDSSGTLPVYPPGSGQVDPPVGLALDKSKGLELGPELIPQPLNLMSGFGAYDATVGSANSYTANSLVARVYPTPLITTVGKGFLCSVSAEGPFRIRDGKTGGTLLAGSGTIRVVSDDINKIQLSATAVDSLVTINSFSIREIKGYHAYQTTTTARSTLSGRYNLLTATKTLSTQSVTTAATDYTFRFEGTGSITLSGTATGVLSAGTHTITCTAGTLTCTVAGTVTSADLRVKRDGSSLPPYQRVDDANTYDTNGFPLFIKRDKTDDDMIVQAPAITGLRAWGSIGTVDVAAATIAAGAYQPFGAISAGEPTCTQWIAIDGALTAAEQAALERYVYSKSKLPVGV